MGKFDEIFQHDRALTGIKTAAPRSERAEDVRGLPEGEWISGGVYRVVTEHEIGGSPGRSGLANPEEDDALNAANAGSRLIFLDLETTGLAGGTGTYAFLCALGAVSGDCFKVTQFFLKNPARETEWLTAIGEYIPKGATLVTYNGKTYDVPLLMTRCVLSRMNPHWQSSPHIDLLYYARKLYKGYLESCSLGSVEKNVLGLNRTGADVPGWLIPEMYLRFLHTGDARPLRGVFYHNELDITSLAVMYRRVSDILAGRAGMGRELLKAGDIWSEKGDAENAARLWEMARGEPQTRAEASLRMALAAKRDKKHEKARMFFISAFNEFKTRENGAHKDEMLTILVELAKMEEHRFARPRKALELVETALGALRRARYFGGNPDAELVKSLRHRHERLTKKIGIREG